jgi:hypothetical protein
MPDLTIAFDPGASLSRVFFTINSDKPELLLMSPYTTLIPQQSLLAYEENAIGIWQDCAKTGKLYAKELVQLLNSLPDNDFSLI